MERMRQTMYRKFMRNLCCEVLMNCIMPVFYGLFLFEVLGKKESPDFDCYATEETTFAIPGIMDIKDDKVANVSYRCRVILNVGFYTSLVNVLILMPMKAFYGMRFFNKDGAMMTGMGN